MVDYSDDYFHNDHYGDTNSSKKTDSSSSSATPAMVSTATWIDDDLEKGNSGLLDIAGIEAGSLKLRDQNNALDGHLRHSNELCFAQQAEIQRLRDAQQANDSMRTPKSFSVQLLLVGRGTETDCVITLDG